MWRFLYRFIIEGQTHLEVLKLSLVLNDWPDVEWSSFKPPHQLRACTENTPNLESFCMQNNQLPTNTPVDLTDNFNSQEDYNTSSSSNNLVNVDIRYVALLWAHPTPQTLLPSDWVGSCLLWLVIAMNHEDCHFKFQNQSWDAKVVTALSKDSCSL